MTVLCYKGIHYHRKTFSRVYVFRTNKKMDYECTGTIEELLPFEQALKSPVRKLRREGEVCFLRVSRADSKLPLQLQRISV